MDLGPLTGLPSLREFLVAEELLDSECRSSTPMQTYGIVMVGVIGVRGLNQRFGLGPSDAMLADLGRRLQHWASTGPRMFVGRVNGGDFALLVNGEPASQRSMVARRVRLHITEDPLRISGGGESVPVDLRFSFRAGPNTKPLRSDLLWDVQNEARIDSVRDLARRVSELERREGLLTVESADLRKRLRDVEELALHDPLTGLLNQRGLEAGLAKLVGPRSWRSLT